MEVNKVKSEVIRYFKMGGFQMRSEVALLIVDKIKELPAEERKKFLSNALANIQNQNIESNSIEVENVKSILRVRAAEFFIMLSICYESQTSEMSKSTVNHR